MNKGIKNLWICLLTAALTLGGMAVMAQGTASVSEDFSGMTAQNVADLSLIHISIFQQLNGSASYDTKKAGTRGAKPFFKYVVPYYKPNDFK